MNKNVTVTANKININHTLKDIPLNGYFLFRYRYQGNRRVLYQRTEILNEKMVICITHGDYQLITDGLEKEEVIPVESINITYDYKE